MNPINRKYFFGRIRHSLFGGTLSKGQVDGIGRVLDYRDEKWEHMLDDELAYVLATIKHETGHTMQPVKEKDNFLRTYLRRKPYYPWFGRGLIQITWEANYKKFGIKNPDDALSWPIALNVAFNGMVFGTFTGRKLIDYINTRRRDYIGARRIINGTDKAKLVAGYADAFLDALTQSREAPPEIGEAA
ncbi:hypothetical protein [Methylosinus sp. Sm6]|uniref:hypothetical protein n=1 Tax=Methylosinus sp. Sm6 TaxID=2866948 RepID=UPI001C98FB61|nr:hypothetical protein [Methylosinus sp. Sm6]MBY6243996.1 hypothetical protein [Methylosinus sp. Sm6]